MGKNKNKGKKEEPKGQFGLAASDIRELRRSIRAAAEEYGTDTVLAALGYEEITEACEALDINMTRPAFGEVKNALKALSGPRVHNNKYARQSGALDLDRA